MTIDWKNKIVYIYKSDMVKVEDAPNEGWRLDIPDFKKKIGDRMDDEDGQVYDDILNHYPGVELGGTVLAPVVEIINGYRVEFENGVYYVLLNGANTNLMEHVILNDVSIRSNNAAGMQDLSLLRSSVYGKDVVLDEKEGRAGVLFPIGTRAYPVNNLTDAKKIAELYNLTDIVVMGNKTFSPTDDISTYSIIGTQPINSIFYFPDGVNMKGSLFYRCLFSGTLTDDAVIEECALVDVTIKSGLVYNTAFMGGTLTIDSGDNVVVFNNCFSVSGEDKIPVLSVGTSNKVSINNYSGILKVTDKVSDGYVNIFSVEGKIVVDSTCTNGAINIFGGEVEDNSGDGCIVTHYSSTIPQEFKEYITDLVDIEKGNWKITNNQMIFFKENGDELMRFDLLDSNGNPTSTNVFERVRV